VPKENEIGIKSKKDLIFPICERIENPNEKITRTKRINLIKQSTNPP